MRRAEQLFDLLEKEDVHRAYAGITSPNPAAIALHEAFGFKRAAHFTRGGGVSSVNIETSPGTKSRSAANPGG
jgi:L-amino acid N-acyltransferase YncA